MCCDGKYIYATSLVAKTAYDDWVAGLNPIDTSAMVSGDFIHDGAIEISCAVAVPNGHGEIYGLTLKEHTSGTLQKKDLRIWIFNGAPATSIVKNAARAWVAADVLNIAGYIDIVTADYLDMQPSSPVDAMVFKNLQNGTTVGSQIVSINALAASQTCYMVIEARASVQYSTSSDIRVRLHLRRK